MTIEEKEFECLVHRYCYYVESFPVISDYEYDMLERDIMGELGDDSPVRFPGSSLPEHYSAEVIAEAEKRMRKKGWFPDFYREQ